MNDTDFKHNVVKAGSHPGMAGGNQWIFRFHNGYGASIVDSPMLTAGADYELAVIEFTGSAPLDYKLTYETPITSDVERGSFEDMQTMLAAIEALEPKTREPAQPDPKPGLFQS